MHTLIYLSFEITDKCNLAHVHTKCPASNKNRYDMFKDSLKITNEDILKFIAYATGTRGFNQFIAFHYYNEPLLELPRILKIIGEARKIKSDVKFSLWTNGLLISRDIGEKTDFLKQFNEVCITCYDEKHSPFFSSLVSHYPNIRVLKHDLDDRMSDLKSKVEYNENDKNRRCWKVNQEFVVDLYGNCHMCCVDYEGSIKTGNIKTDNYDVIYSNWLINKNKISNMCQSKEQFDNAYEVCKKCYLHNLFGWAR